MKRRPEIAGPDMRYGGMEKWHATLCENGQEPLEEAL